MGEPFVWKGLVIRQWPLELNTALLLGNDYVRLLARVHAQCEIHGWIDGPNRSWFAELIDGGRAVGLFRADQGWEDVATFMRANDTDPVAMSYSVTDSFLSGEWVPDEYKTYDENGYYDMDRWEDVPDDQKWHLGEAWLRSDHADNELKPENWSGLYFGHMLSYFDLMRSDNEAVLESKRDALVADQANVKANVLG
jgi:hypothetical protein